MGKQKRQIQIENIHDICVHLQIFTNNSRKHDGATKPFSNRRYCQTNQWGRGKDHFKENICMIFLYIYTYLPRILENSTVQQNHFQIEDIVKQPRGKRKKSFQIEDIHDICDYL